VRLLLGGRPARLPFRGAALTRIVMAVDPPGSARSGADACGLAAAGRGEDGTLYVLAEGFEN